MIRYHHNQRGSRLDSYIASGAHMPSDFDLPQVESDAQIISRYYH